MKKIILISLVTITLSCIQSTVIAQQQSFAVGAIIGSPDGVSYKARVSEDLAVAGAVSFSISDNFSSFYTHADILMHKQYETPGWEAGQLHYYYGGGLRILWQQFSDDNLIGIRLPSGVGFDFNDVPINLFFELVPGATVSPDFSFGFDGALGFRFYLN